MEVYLNSISTVLNIARRLLPPFIYGSVLIKPWKYIAWLDSHPRIENHVFTTAKKLWYHRKILGNFYYVILLVF